MIVALEIKTRTPLVGGAIFGASGAYDRIEGTAAGTLVPASEVAFPDLPGLTPRRAPPTMWPRCRTGSTPNQPREPTARWCLRSGRMGTSLRA